MKLRFNGDRYDAYYFYDTLVITHGTKNTAIYDFPTYLFNLLNYDKVSFLFDYVRTGSVWRYDDFRVPILHYLLASDATVFNKLAYSQRLNKWLKKKKRKLRL